MKKITTAAQAVLLILFSILFSFFIAEWGYRVYLKLKNHKKPLSYWMSPSVHTLYDEKYGQRIKPNDESCMNVVRNGKLGATAIIYKSNANGFDGKTLQNEYDAADKKILVFGDSFSHWNRNGVSWPDLLQDNLNKGSGEKFAVLNYARGAYGVFQMLDLAADKVTEQKPALAIIAVIGDDFSRDRWWDGEVKINGVSRWMFSSNKNNLTDYKNAGDYALIVPGATKEWAEKHYRTKDKNDPVLKAANAQYLKIREDIDRVVKHVPLFSWDHSFLYSKITTGVPFKKAYTLRRTLYTDYIQDLKTADNIKRLKASGVPILFVFLPLKEEFENKNIKPTFEIKKGQNLSLKNSMERMFADSIHMLQNEYKGVVPKKIDLAPIDMHPNFEGLKLYADIIAPIALKKLTHK